MSLSAGDAIILSDDDGSTYATLIPEPKVADDDIYYESGTIGMDPIGLTLTMDIPGDEFPAVEGLKLPEFRKLDPSIASKLRDLVNNPTIRWTPTDIEKGSGVGLLLNLVGLSPDDNSLPTVVSCRVKNDGEFTIPKDVVSRLRYGLVPSASSAVQTIVTPIAQDGLGILVLQVEIIAASNQGLR